jgi:hypothetical protein
MPVCRTSGWITPRSLTQMPIDAEPRLALAARFRWQAVWCGSLGSPLYEHLLTRAASDLESRGVVWRVLEPYASQPATFAHHLRLMGAVHRMVLEGDAPELAAHYPSAGGDGDASAAWVAFKALLGTGEVRLDHAVQTNEVGRSAALLGGFLTVAQETGLGLRILELGASAGLNLRWDRFRFEAPDWAFGDPSSRATVRADYASGRPPLPRLVWVSERAGCDAAPIDATTHDGALTLQSYVWPDQAERLELLRAAIEVARQTPATVDKADAADWLDERLARERGGMATVVYHSVFWGYLTDAGRERIKRALHEAGAKATEAEPLAWLRMETGADQTDVTLTTWPGGEERLLATAGYHGRPVTWLGGY